MLHWVLDIKIKIRGGYPWVLAWWVYNWQQIALIVIVLLFVLTICYLVSWIINVHTHAFEFWKQWKRHNFLAPHQIKIVASLLVPMTTFSFSTCLILSMHGHLMVAIFLMMCSYFSLGSSSFLVHLSHVIFPHCP